MYTDQCEYRPFHWYSLLKHWKLSKTHYNHGFICRRTRRKHHYRLTDTIRWPTVSYVLGYC